ncbi:MAG: class I adenylate-forming enzyme family protein [Hyphomicrobiales bacterium]
MTSLHASPTVLLGHALDQSVRRFADRPALVSEQRSLTYAGFDREVNRLAHALLEMGVGPGDRVAISLANRIELFTAYFAAQRIGSVAVLLNFNLTPAEVAVIGGDCEPAVWLYDARTSAALGEAANDFKTVRRYISCSGPELRNSISYERLIEGRPEIAPPLLELAADAPSLIMYTSGTTGRPKGVILSHAAQWLNTVLMVAEIGFSERSRALHVAPLYHVAAFHVVALPVLFVGGVNVIAEKYNAAAIAGLVETHGVTCVLGAPTHFEMWSQEGRLPSPASREALEQIIVTGAPVRPETVEWIIQSLSENLWDVYGQTEACSLISLVPPDQISRMGAVNCIGRPLLGMDVALIPEHSSIADGLKARARRGELVSRGPKLMNGYYGMPEKTAATIEDGWLRTGDLVEVDDDGYYYYLGRVDDMIITGGENVYPVEIEEVLLTCPGVADCVVAGIPDDRWGQLITAFVVAGGRSFELAAAEEIARSRLAPHKRPRRWELIEEIPRSPSGKVLVRVLLERMKSTSRQNAGSR